MTKYAPEVLGEDEDDGTMPENVDALREAVVGHRIVSVETGVDVPSEYYRTEKATVITLDDGKQVKLVDTDDCCAFTELQAFLLHPELVDHMVTSALTNPAAEGA